MTMRNSRGNLVREAQMASLTSLTSGVAVQLTGLVQQTQSSDLPESAALAAIIDGLSSVFNQLQKMQADLTAQGGDFASTYNALERAHQRYRDLFELAPDAYLVTDADSRILEANQAAIRLIGYARTSTYGRSLLSFVAPESALQAVTHLRALEEASADHVDEWEMRFHTRRRGQHRLVRARVRHTPDRFGSNRSFLWLLRREPREAQPRRPELAEPAIGDGLVTRTPLVVDMPEPIRTVRDNAADTHGHGARGLSDPRRPVAIVELVRQVAALHQTRLVQVFTHGTIPAIQAHPDELQRALGLILDYVNQSAPPEAPLHIRVLATDAAVAVVVTSGGAAPLLDREARPLSPGWVLDPARVVVEAHGGTLECATNDDGRCAVTIRLPADVERRRGRARRTDQDERDPSPRVSRREREVLGLLEQGLTNRQISEHLVLSERTVEHHISRMLARFRLSTRTHLTAYALKHHLTGVSSVEGG
jgi:PAS domain S-box-containing protein